MNPCEELTCPTGSRCEVFRPTGEAFCQPSCELDNGGCASNETCTLREVQCSRVPCPPIVRCIPSGWCVEYNHVCVINVYLTETCPIEGQVFTTCGTACPPTCSEPGPVACTLQCVVGCQCPSGTVLEERRKKCVTPDQCGM